MPPSSAPGWLGAPPVYEDGFAYANGEFFAEASNQNRHRRAAPAELQEYFSSGSDKDHPAHWFEAQLIHYGLKPSKTKAVAKKRLCEEVQAGRLAVPGHISGLEDRLKKEWTKKDREAKKKTDKGKMKKTETETETKTKMKTVAGVKRKVEVSIDLETNAVTVSSSESLRQITSKKVKTAATPKKTTSKAASATSAKAATKQEKKLASNAASATKAGSATQKKAAATSKKTAASKAPDAATGSAAPPRTKQMARCRRGGISQGPSRGVSSAARSSPSPPRFQTKQTARRSNPFMGRGRIPAPPMDDDDDDDDDDNDDNDSMDLDDGDNWGEEEVSLAPLGVINGRYEVSSSYVTSEWPDLGSDFDLVLTSTGSSLWGSFDVGVIEGVMHFDKRPRKSPHKKIWFHWRGRENEGPIMYGNGNQGWIKFLGDGRVEGRFDFQNIEFRGRRLPGQGTRSEVDARSLQNEWDEYSEDAYERENQARWG